LAYAWYNVNSFMFSSNQALRNNTLENVRGADKNFIALKSCYEKAL